MVAYLELLPVSIEQEGHNPMVILARGIYALPNTGGQRLKWTMDSLIIVSNELLLQSPFKTLSRAAHEARLRPMLEAVLGRCETMNKYIEILYTDLNRYVLKLVHSRRTSWRNN